MASVCFVNASTYEKQGEIRILGTETHKYLIKTIHDIPDCLSGENSFFKMTDNEASE